MQLFFKEKKKIETNIAPLIDIVFLLLIFFMLANEFIDYETIDMTSPSQSIMEDSTKKPIVIFLSEKGIIKINNENFTHSQIKDYLKEQLINNKSTDRLLIVLNESTHPMAPMPAWPSHRFIRNLESRIYAQLSRQLVENLFGETASTEGTLTLEGNTITYSVENGIITLVITDSNGDTTTIQLPIGNFSF